MGAAIGADQACAVHGKADGQVLDADIMHDLVIGALQESRVYSAEGFVAFGRHTRRKCDGVLFRDAHIKHAVGEFMGEDIKACAAIHRGGNADDFIVLLGLFDQALGEHLSVARHVGFWFELVACDHVEFGNAVHFVCAAFGRGVAFAFFSDNVQQDRAFVIVADIAQDRQQGIHVVTVYRADIVKAQLFKECSESHRMARSFFGAGCHAFKWRGQHIHGALGGFAGAYVRFGGYEAAKIFAHRADGGRDGHVVIVQNDQHTAIHGACVVHGFVCHACGNRTVTDDGDHVIVFAREITCDRHAEASGNTGGAMGGAERIVFALGAFGKA